MTCLSASEIVDLYEKFCALGGQRAEAGAMAEDVEATGSAPESAAVGDKKAPLDKLLLQEEFKNNPFARALHQSIAHHLIWTPG